MALMYSNENFPFPVVDNLRQLGHDVLTIQETGRAGQAISDEAVLKFAGDAGRILLTLNRKHFIRLHNQKKNQSGIIVCSFDSDFIGLANRIHKAVEGKTDFPGQLIRINRPG